MSKNIAIFASGGGSNAEVIIQHFNTSTQGNIALIVTNRKDAYVIERAKNHEIPYCIHQKQDLQNGQLLAILKAMRIDFVVLAGYLQKISADLIEHYPNKIVNIHPALLPKFGGKGMYGMHVHQAVVANKETQSGITIHYVNEHYDEGNIIEQHTCLLSPEMSAEDVQKSVLQLEHTYFAPCIERLL